MRARLYITEQAAQIYCQIKQVLAMLWSRADLFLLRRPPPTRRKSKAWVSRETASLQVG